MKSLLIPISFLALAVIIAIPAAQAETLYTPVSVTSSTDATDLWPASNLIQGPDVGYDSAAPNDQLGGGDTHRWVTDAPGGFPSDYIEVAGGPILTFDLGADVAINAISTWGYSADPAAQTGNANGVSDFSLRFATDAEGTAGFGTSIAFNPTYTQGLADLPRNSNAFGQMITARYVEMTVLDNYFTAPGDNSVYPPGGDRAGLGEVAFSIPEPGTALLGLVGLFAMGLIRRRK